MKAPRPPREAKVKPPKRRVVLEDATGRATVLNLPGGPVSWDEPRLFPAAPDSGLRPKTKRSVVIDAGRHPATGAPFGENADVTCGECAHCGLLTTKGRKPLGATYLVGETVVPYEGSIRCFLYPGITRTGVPVKIAERCCNGFIPKEES